MDFRVDSFFCASLRLFSSLVSTRCRIFLLALLMAASSLAGETTGTIQGTRLYTKPDPSASGGISGKTANLPAPITGVFAIPQDSQLKVYKAELAEDGKSFSFKNLPVAKYDLLILSSNDFYEGIALSRSDNSLTDRDLKLIDPMVMKSTPFFDTKKINRIAGVTGREGKSIAVLQEVRTKPVTLQSEELRTDIQIRSLKLCFMEDVGEVGWQVVETREIVRTEVGPGAPKGLITHYYSPRLNGIRVTDTVKDLGELNLIVERTPDTK
ncbi:MAG: hypothetical protein HY343_02085 [Lentisphaerae bacterium]|nr:hypothetical protein [Lentisphaerota bacterium]